MVSTSCEQLYEQWKHYNTNFGKKQEEKQGFFEFFSKRFWKESPSTPWTGLGVRGSYAAGVATVVVVVVVVDEVVVPVVFSVVGSLGVCVLPSGCSTGVPWTGHSSGVCPGL